MFAAVRVVRKFAELLHHVSTAAFIFFVAVLPQNGAASDIDSDNYIKNGTVTYSKACSRHVDKKIYLGLKRSYRVYEHEGGVLYYEDYIKSVVNSISSVDGRVDVSFESILSHANNAFFPDFLIRSGGYSSMWGGAFQTTGRGTFSTPGRGFSTTFYDLKNFYFKGDEGAISIVENSYNEEKKILLSYKDKIYSGDAYCKVIDGKNLRKAFLILPINYISERYFSALDCLRLSVLRTFCYDVKADAKTTKTILEQMFVRDDYGKDSLTEFGADIVRGFQ